MSGISSTRPTKAWVLLYSMGPSHNRFYIQNWDGPKAKCSVCLQQVSQHQQCIWYAIKLAHTSRKQLRLRTSHNVLKNNTSFNLFRYHQAQSWYQLTHEPGNFTNKLLGIYSPQTTHTYIRFFHIQSHNGTIHQNPAYKLKQLILSENSSHVLFSTQSFKTHHWKCK